jgi:hypothetical protein
VRRHPCQWAGAAALQHVCTGMQQRAAAGWGWCGGGGGVGNVAMHPGVPTCGPELLHTLPFTAITCLGYKGRRAPRGRRGLLAANFAGWDTQVGGRQPLNTVGQLRGRTGVYHAAAWRKDAPAAWPRPCPALAEWACMGVHDVQRAPRCANHKRALPPHPSAAALVLDSCLAAVPALHMRVTAGNGMVHFHGAPSAGRGGTALQGAAVCALGGLCMCSGW